jgi:uncharacterized RDD family membrane protein YckC
VIDAIVVVGALLAESALGTMLVMIVNAKAGDSFYDVIVAVAAWTWMALVFGYHPACWYFFRATPGQRALGLKVVRLSDGTRLGVVGVLVRFLIFSVETLMPPLGLVSAITASKDPFKRAWHDEAAGSVVVQRS